MHLIQILLFSVMIFNASFIYAKPVDQNLDLVKTEKLTSPGWVFSDMVDHAGPAGDVDGNGYSDFVAVRRNNNNFTFMLFTGRQNGPANTPSWSQSFTGSSFEVQVSTAGDVNGDGFSDVMLSQPYASNGQNFEGMVSVWLGSASGLANGNADWTFECNQADARCGLGLSPLGDINGDGFGDVMIGAPNWDQTQTDEGAVFIFYGSATGLSLVPDQILYGSQFSPGPDIRLGGQMGFIGDSNGDGYPESWIGGQLFSYNAQGAVLRILSGSNSGINLIEPLASDVLLKSGFCFGGMGDIDGDDKAEFGYSFKNQADGQYYLYVTDVNASFQINHHILDVGTGYCSSRSLEQAGDVDGDGRSEFLSFNDSDLLSVNRNTNKLFNLRTVDFSAYLANLYVGVGDVNGDGFADVLGDFNDGVNAGLALFYGYADTVEPEHNQVSLDEQMLVDNLPGYQSLGSAVAGWGVPGPEYNQGVNTGLFAVGLPKFNGNAGSDSGGVLVCEYGQEYDINHFSAEFSPVECLNPAFYGGDQAGDQLGSDLAGVGDVNGDGYPDFVMSAPYASNGSDYAAGAAYLVYGQASGMLGAKERIAFGAATSRYGYSVSGAGDINGDGYSDVIIGAPFWPEQASFARGAALIYLGSSNGLITTPHRILRTTYDGLFGWSVAGVNDVNRDGFDDVVVGVPNYDGGALDSGLALLYLGSEQGLADVQDVVFSAGGTAYGKFGSEVDAGGDINGDGWADIVVASPGANTVYVFYGVNGGVNQQPSNTLSGAALGNGDFGSALAGGFDFNGDGFSDLAVGAPRANNEDSNGDTILNGLGRLMIFAGSGSGLQSEPMVDTGLISRNRVQGQRFGHALAGLSRSGATPRLLIGSPEAASSGGEGILEFLTLASEFVPNVIQMQESLTPGEHEPLQLNNEGLNQVSLGARIADDFNPISGSSDRFRLLFGYDYFANGLSSLEKGAWLSDTDRQNEPHIHDFGFMQSLTRQHWRARFQADPAQEPVQLFSPWVIPPNAPNLSHFMSPQTAFSRPDMEVEIAEDAANTSGNVGFSHNLWFIVRNLDVTGIAANGFELHIDWPEAYSDVSFNAALGVPPDSCEADGRACYFSGAFSANSETILSFTATPDIQSPGEISAQLISHLGDDDISNNFDRYARNYNLVSGTQIFVVDDPYDGPSAVDANPGNGVCQATNGHTCTLRAAIEEANSVPDKQLIMIDVDAAITVSQTMPILPTITDPVIIRGNHFKSRPVISGGDAQSLFTVNMPANIDEVLFDYLALSNGQSATDGAAIQIVSGPEIEIRNCVLDGNHARNGGAVYTNDPDNLTSLIISDSTFQNNSATQRGGALYAQSFGDYYHDFQLINSTFDTNTAGGGGGAVWLAVTDYDARITGSLFVNNQAAYSGAISLGGAGAHSRILIKQTGIVNNQATSGSGGGLSMFDGLGIVMENSTVANNTASSRGGGIYFEELSDSSFTAVTLANNTAAVEGGGFYDENGDAGNLSLSHTVFSANTLTNHQLENCAGAMLASQGYNASDDSSCSGLVAASDITATSLNLQPQADLSSGTVLPLTGSPLIDSGNPLGLTDYRGQSIDVDQLSSVRPYDGDGDGSAIPDRGAIELRTSQVAEAQISVDIFDSVDPVLTHGSTIYSYQVHNYGPDPATNIDLIIEIPQGVSVQTMGLTDWSCSMVTTLDCHLNSLVANIDAPLITVTVDTDGSTPASISTGASVSADELDTTLSNNTDEESTVVGSQLNDMAVTLKDVVDPVATGDDLVYTLTVENVGTLNAEQVSLSLSIPNDVSFESIQQDGTWICTLSASDINCSKPLVQAGELSSFVLTYATTPGLQTSVNQTADLSADSDDNMTNNAVSEQTILSGLTEMVFQSSFETE